MTRAWLVSVHRDKAFVKPENHRGEVQVQISHIHPWWSMNPDLAGSTHVDDEEPEEDIAPLSPADYYEPWPDNADAPEYPTEDPEPPVEETKPEVPKTMIATAYSPSRKTTVNATVTQPPAPPRTIKHPRMIIGEQVQTNWIDIYSQYLKSLEDREGVQELLTEADRCCENALQALNAAGVTLAEEPAVKVVPLVRGKVNVRTTEPKKEKPAGRSPGCYSKTSRAFLQWLQAYSKTGDPAYAISSKQLASDIGVSPSTVHRSIVPFMTGQGYLTKKTRSERGWYYYSFVRAVPSIPGETHLVLP